MSRSCRTRRSYRCNTERHRRTGRSLRLHGVAGHEPEGAGAPDQCGDGSPRVGGRRGSQLHGQPPSPEVSGSARRYTVGLVTPDISNPFFAPRHRPGPQHGPRAGVQPRRVQLQRNPGPRGRARPPPTPEARRRPDRDAASARATTTSRSGWTGGLRSSCSTGAPSPSRSTPSSSTTTGARSTPPSTWSSMGIAESPSSRGLPGHLHEHRPAGGLPRRASGPRHRGRRAARRGGRLPARAGLYRDQAAP